MMKRTFYRRFRVSTTRRMSSSLDDDRATERASERASEAGPTVMKVHGEERFEVSLDGMVKRISAFSNLSLWSDRFECFRNVSKRMASRNKNTKAVSGSECSPMSACKYGLFNLAQIYYQVEE